MKPSFSRLIFTSSLILLLRFFLVSPGVTSDSIAVVSGAEAGLACLKNGIFSGCREVQHFPLFQYLIAALGFQIGFKSEQILQGFVYLNIVSFFALIAIVFREFKRNLGRWAADWGVLALIASPLYFYGSSSFNEMTASLLTSLFTLSSLLGWNPFWIGILFFLSGITKEVSVPFLLLMGGMGISHRWNHENQPQKIKNIIALCVSSICVVGVTALFNYFRFGTLRNTNNLNPLSTVPSFSQWCSHFFGLWASPNGGVLWFWSAWSLLIVGVGVKVFRPSRFFTMPRVRQFHALGTCALLFVLIAGFALWYAPFGWIAWGSRLLVPWIPSIMILVLFLFSSESQELLSQLLSTRLRQGMTAALILGLSLVQIRVLFPPALLWDFFDPDSVCPVIGSISENQDYYYHCLNHLIWTKKPLIFSGWTLPFTRIFVFHFFFYVLSLGLLLCSVITSLPLKSRAPSKSEI